MTEASNNFNAARTPRHPSPGDNAFATTPRPLSRLSSYTLKSMHPRTSSNDSSSETCSLMGNGKGKGAADSAAEPVRRYGAVSDSSDGIGISSKDARRQLLLWAGVKMAILFVVCTAALWATLKVALPTLEEQDRPDLKVPRSFEELQRLNALLKKYRSLYPYRTVLCFVITYLFLQAFSLPGSMYMSILAGAVWGPARAVPLCCTCVASGATLCYFIGAALGPALLVLPTWKARLDTWSKKIDSQRANLISFLIVLRIAPFPPHWVVNVLCPHLGITLFPFFVSTWLGILGVTVIHTTIGSGLDQMTSPKDFHLISWRNFLGLASIVVAVLIPVGIRWWFRGELQAVKEGQDAQAQAEADVDVDDDLEAGNATAEVDGPLPADWKGKTVDRWLLEDALEDDFYDDEPLPPPPTPPQGSSDGTGSSSSSLPRYEAAGAIYEDVKVLG